MSEIGLGIVAGRPFISELKLQTATLRIPRAFPVFGARISQTLGRSAWASYSSGLFACLVCSFAHPDELGVLMILRVISRRFCAGEQR